MSFLEQLWDLLGVIFGGMLRRIATLATEAEVPLGDLERPEV